ncbi:aromatic acid exporter family protein [Cytobacillus sp. FJAT-54145]|uniref:Aromatic acid exporter family protein n=1 Tax=Cytobacillus spartinae TaxID=3299023 RepID=A0ABW6K8Q7_9BACI
MKLGARIFKTGLAIILSLFIARLFELPSPVFAGIAAIFAVQPTIYRSYLSIIEQIQGNLIGAIISVLFVLLLGNDIIIIGLAAIIVITINLKLKIENTIPLSLVTVIAIMENPGDGTIEFSLIRFSTIMLGVLSAFIVNLVFLPPKYETKLYYKLSNTTEEITKWIRMNSRHASEHTLLKNDIEKLKETTIKIDQLFIMYKEERNYFKRNDIVKARKLVIYRQMISLTKRALETLKRLHRFENELSHLPDQFQSEIQHHLDCLIDRHEQVMLKFIGKIKPQVPITEGSYCLNKKELFNLLLSQQKAEDETAFFHTMQVISAMIEYDEHLEHLDVLITSFLSYHKDENEVTIEEEMRE